MASHGRFLFAAISIGYRLCITTSANVDWRQQLHLSNCRHALCVSDILTYLPPSILERAGGYYACSFCASWRFRMCWSTSLSSQYERRPILIGWGKRPWSKSQYMADLDLFPSLVCRFLNVIKFIWCVLVQFNMLQVLQILICQEKDKT